MPSQKQESITGTRKHINFSAALRSFLGYLEGTSKAEHTIRNYRFDLMAFEDFLRGVPLEQITPEHIEEFHAFLRKQGLKTNTRRRKLLTVRRFLGYLSRRRKVPEVLDRRVGAPEKIERIPFIVQTPELVARIRELPREGALEMRNRVLLWALAETGAQVSEVRQLRFESWEEDENGAWVRIQGKFGRRIPVSKELLEAVAELRSRVEAKGAGEIQLMFLGFTRHGSLGTAITPRGVELLVKAYGSKLVEEPRPGLVLVPRTFRHSIAVHWFRNGVTRDEIRKRLGLRTAYAFRTYEPLFRLSAGQTE